MRKLEFNIAGPCLPGEHYMLDPLRGIGNELMDLIDGKKYFVIHAARQSGKSTLLLDIVDKINNEGNYHAVYCSLETIGNFDEPEKAIPSIVESLKLSLADFDLPAGFGIGSEEISADNILRATLTAYCRTLSKPLVIFFDEADCMENRALISFLRQLRNGYVTRGRTPFVRSVVLTGMRNLRDYKAIIRPDAETLGGLSPFNIIAESFNLRNFTKAEITELYAQHTAETGQVFKPQMIDYVFEQTQGQPWLVNAIARECVEKLLKKDYSAPVTQAHAKQAIQDIILDRRTHIDSLMDKLKDPRVRKVILPLLTGEEIYETSSNDYLYTRDLGIIRENNGQIEPANPIYSEMITRTLNWDVQESIKRRYDDFTIPHYLKDGKIDIDYLIRDFQVYWRENSEIWKDRYKKGYFEYEEAAPHLVLLAFLQRVINGGGQVTREMATGTKRVDLCITYKDRKYPIELKILQNENSRNDSYKQILRYMDNTGSDTGWLVIFDRDTEKPWDEKIYMKEETVEGKKIVIAGC